MLRSRIITHRWRIGVLSLIFSALALLGVGGYAPVHAAANASLYSYVPLNCPVVASVDLPWLWKATAEARKNLIDGNNSTAIEGVLEFAIEYDVLPWAGQMAFALTDVTGDIPSGALLLQVRDNGHAADAAKLQTLLQIATRSKWLPLEYKGIAIQRTEMKTSSGVLKIALAMDDGWMIITLGDGVIRKVIDTHNGASPSLEKHPLFVKAMGGLPAEAVGQFCVNGQGLLPLAAKQDADGAKVMKAAGFATMFLAGAVSGAENDPQFDTVGCSSSTKIQAMLKQLRADAGTVSGNSLAQLPDGAFATVLVHNPDAWVGAVERWVLDIAAAMGDADMRKDIQGGFDATSGLRAMLKRCTGELGVGVAWKKDTGFGVTAAGETHAAEDAAAVSTGVKEFLENQDMTVEDVKNLHTLPETTDDGKVFPTLICWSTREQWLLAASYTSWLARPTAQPSLALPDSARGANLVAFGNSAYILAAMKESIEGNADVIKQFETITPLFGSCVFAMKIDEDGGATRSHFSGSVMPMLAVVFPIFTRAREKARAVTSSSNVRDIVAAIQMYAQDHHEQLPVMKTAADLKKLDIDAPVLISPRTGEPYTPNPSISGKSIGAFADPATIIAVYEKTPGGDGSHIAAFLDGHVERITADKWDEAKRRSHIP